MKSALAILTLILFSAKGYTQVSDRTDRFTIIGRVLDEHNEPVIGATVITYEQQFKNGESASDINGDFRIELSATKDSLLSTHIIRPGYKEVIINRLQFQNTTVDIGEIKLQRTVPIEEVLLRIACPSMLYLETPGTNTISSDELEKAAY